MRSGLYSNIYFFKLKKELPGCEINDVVNICEVNGREKLWINGIDFPFDFAHKHPDWFEPVTYAQHEPVFRENTILYFMATGRSREDSERLYDSDSKYFSSGTS